MGSRVLFSVSPGDGLPLYRQIVEQVKGAVASGLLAAGDRLPSHRDLARELLVAPLTVKRAYDVLEGEGLVETRRGRGTFVAAATRETRADARADLEARLRAVVRQARLLGLDERELEKRMRRAWRRRAQGRVQP